MTKNTKLIYITNPVKQNVSTKPTDFLGIMLQTREHPTKKLCIGFLHICVKF